MRGAYPTAQTPPGAPTARFLDHLKRSRVVLAPDVTAPAACCSGQTPRRHGVQVSGPPGMPSDEFDGS